MKTIKKMGIMLKPKSVLAALSSGVLAGIKARKDSESELKSQNNQKRTSPVKPTRKNRWINRKLQAERAEIQCLKCHPSTIFSKSVHLVRCERINKNYIKI